MSNHIARDSLLAVQVAQINALRADSVLMSTLAADGVYDNVPEGTGHPYIVIGEAIQTPDNAHDRFGKEVVATNHVWSKQKGYKEALEIMDRMVAVLEEQPLLIDGFHHVATRFEFSQTLRDPDLNIRHALARFRIVVEQGSRF